MSVKALKGLADAIPKILQLDVLKDLAKEHPILAASYMALTMQINAILMATTELSFGGFEVFNITFAEEKFPPTLEGKLDAISYAFQIEEARLHDLMEAQTLAEVWGKGGFTRIAEQLIKTGGKVVVGATGKGAEEE